MTAIKEYKMIAILRADDFDGDRREKYTSGITVRARSQLHARRLAMEAAWSEGCHVRRFVKIKEVQP